MIVVVTMVVIVVMVMVMVVPMSMVVPMVMIVMMMVVGVFDLGVAATADRAHHSTSNSLIRI